MLKIKVSNDSAKFLRSREPKHKRQIAAKLQSLREESEPADSETLKGSNREYRRADIGEYRIIYRVSSNTLYVDAIGKRNDGAVYKRFNK